MRKINQALSRPVKKLVKTVGVEILTYDELIQKVNSGTKVVTDEDDYFTAMATKKAWHSVDMNVIAVDDNALVSTEDTNELVIHELIHFVRPTQVFDNDVDQQTEECVAQVGMFKLTLILGLNPAPYAYRTLEYIKQFPKARFKKVEAESDKAVEYLVKFLGMTKVG